MAKKIIVLNGSPRPKGNTSALIEEFKRGAEEAGSAVTVFELDKMDIHGCKGCFGGVMKVGDIKGHQELKEAYELGKSAAAGNGT